MKSQWGKRNGCKFASDAVLNGDWGALYGLMIQSGLSAECPYPSNQGSSLNIVTWSRRFNTTHPNRDLVRHDIKAEIHYGMPLLHQVVVAEGIENKKSFRQGLQVLLDNGADIDAQDSKYGYTALHWACMLCRSHLMQYLIEQRADRSITSYSGKTATEMMPKWCKTVIRHPSDTEEEEEL